MLSHFKKESGKILQETERAQKNLMLFERMLYKKTNRISNTNK